MKCLWCVLLLCRCTPLSAWTDEYKAIQKEAYDLLVGRRFSFAAFGMKVDKSRDDGARIVVETTGCVFIFDKKSKTIALRQRLGKPRSLATLAFDAGVSWEGLSIRDRASGAVWIATENDGFRARINCDSLLMFAFNGPAALTVTLEVSPLCFVSFADRYQFLDNYGGLSLYPLTLRTFRVADEVHAVTVTTDREKSFITPDGRLHYRLGADEIFWASPAPTKPYAWDRRPSNKRNIAWYLWYKSRAPTEEEIKRWAGFSDVLVLQSPDGSLYEHEKNRRPSGRGAMTRTFMPIDPVAFTKTIDTAHRAGMKVVAYAGPMYFRAAVPRRGPPGDIPEFTRGAAADNFPEFRRAVEQLKRAYPIDGIYFDELYPPNTVRAYTAVRTMRELFGDEGFLFEHNDANFHCVTCPPATLCWHNAQAAGEALSRYYRDRNWLRYACSTFNIANCNDYLCLNFMSYFHLTGARQHLDDALLQKCLDYNIHQFYASWWETLYHRQYYPKYFAPFWQRYLRVMGGLDTRKQRTRVQRTCARENAQPRTRWKAYLAGLVEPRTLPSLERLSFPQPIELEGRVDVPTRLDLGKGWTAFFGPKSKGRIEARDDRIHITARRDTCAYVERELSADIREIRCRIKTAPGNGHTYGPGIGLRWTTGDPRDMKTGFHPHFRMTLTQRGTLAARHERSVTANMRGFPAGKWVSLRYRLLDGWVVGEVQRADGAWRPVQIMLIPSRPTSVLVGKSADLNRDIDIGGAMSECWIEGLRLF